MDEVISHADFLILSEDMFPESDLLFNTLTELKGECFYQLFKSKFIYSIIFF